MPRSKEGPHRESHARRRAPSTLPTSAAGTADRPSRRAILGLASLTAAYAMVYGTIVSVKFRYYLYSDFDLAIFTQATDQALRGTLFNSIRGMNWLGDHVSLILFVIAPLYALFRHPLTLLLLQSLALALGAIPVFALARRELGHEGIALAFAALYLLHPAVGYTNLFEFHPEVLATSTLLATFWALSAGRLGLTLLFAGLSLACREDVALVVMMLGLVSLLPGRPRRFAFPLIALAAASLVLSFAVIRPAFSSAAAEYGRMYGSWGATLGEVALNLLKHPLRAIGSFVSTPGDPLDALLKRLYWPQMLAPLLFLPLLSPLTLIIALPVLAEHFLSSRLQQHWMQYQYTALVTPVLMVAAVRGLGNLVRRVARAPAAATGRPRPGRARTLGVVVTRVALLTSLVCNVLYGPLLAQGWIWTPGTPQRNWPSTHDRTRRPFRDRAVARIPHEGGVVAGFEFLARLASRRDVHSIHHIYTGYYTYSTRPYPVPTGIAALLADVSDPAYVIPGTPLRMRDLVARNDLRPVDAAGDLLLFVRAATDTVELIRVGAPPPAKVRSVTYDQQLAFRGFSLPESSVAVTGLLPVETQWQRVAQVDRHFMTQLVLQDAGGSVVFSVLRQLGYLVYPVAEWPADAPVRETYRMVIPAGVRPGVYALGLRVAWWRGGSARARLSDPPPGNGPDAPRLSEPDDPRLRDQNMIVPLGRITVTAPTHAR